jgi:release factor glutamine methyltransferase
MQKYPCPSAASCHEIGIEGAGAHPTIEMANDLELGDGSDLDPAWYLLRPSEHTAALLQTLLGMRDFVRGAEVLEIGSGSGVVLAALAGMGAATLCGIDSEDQAVRAGEALLRSLGAGALAEFRRGNLWGPAADRQFDLVVANLPHFPCEASDFPGRLPSWSDGGRDGRRLLDPFLDGLARHLAPSGRAVITHNGFVDLARTRRRLARDGLTARIARTVMLTLPIDKRDRMTTEIRIREEGRTIRSLGRYSFGRVDILDIRARGTRR